MVHVSDWSQTEHGPDFAVVLGFHGAHDKESGSTLRVTNVEGLSLTSGSQGIVNHGR